MVEYIDREALVEHLEYLNNELPLITEHDWGRAKGYDEVIDEIKKYPSADVQPVVHGKWEERDCGFDVECKCSACGYKDFVEKYDRYWFNRNYCPNCGARMEGET